MAANPRTTAARTLNAIIGNGRSLDRALAEVAGELADDRDRAFVHELVYGTLRWYWRLLPELRALLQRPLKARDRDIEMLLLAGLYQIHYLSTPAHAAVAATVDACLGLNKSWAKGLINGVLRNAIRALDARASDSRGSAATTTAHPAWFVEALRRDWPAQWEDMLTANNERPPLTLRVNHKRTSRDDLLARFTRAGLSGVRTHYSPVGITLTEAAPVSSIPGFSEGLVSVQDEAAQLAATLLDTPAGPVRILDACAAPGGKSAHLLESISSPVELIALDVVERRTAKMRAGLDRLGLDATLATADATEVGAWWDGRPFDRILIDAPCSGSGVMRRHPDIKLHRRASDIVRFATTQRHLLAALWPLLKPGGKLLYASCSVLKAENDEVVKEFLTQTRGAAVDRFDAAWGIATDCGRQIPTGERGMDGFYYARLCRAAL